MKDIKVTIQIEDTRAKVRKIDTLREKFGPRAQLCSREFSSAMGGGCAARFVLFKLIRVAVKVMVKEEKLWSMSDVSSPIEVLLNILFLHFLTTLEHFLSIPQHILMHENVSLT